MDSSRKIPNEARRSEESELRTAVQYAVIQLCAGEDAASNTTRMSPKAIASLAELTFLYATSSLTSDLEAFSSHAGRKTITDSDVKLVARKNPDGLLDKLEDYCKEHFDSSNESSSTGNLKRRKKKASTSLLMNTEKDEVNLMDQDDSVLSSSSSDDDLLSTLDKIGKPARASQQKIKKRTLPPTKMNIFDGLDESDASSDDDELLRQPTNNRRIPPTAAATATTAAIGQRKPAPMRRPFDNDDSSSSSSSSSSLDDMLGKPVGKPIAPKKRFRLGAGDGSSSKTQASPDQNSTVEDDPIVDDSSPPKTGGGSRIKAILEGLSQDSLSSSGCGLDKENSMDLS